MSASERGRWALVAALLLAVILVPFVAFGEPLDAWATPWLEAAPDGPFAAGAFALLAADVILPVPSSVVAVAAGVRLGPIAAAIVIWAGLQAGCALAWAAGRFVGDPVIVRLVGPREQDRARRWLLGDRGLLILAACRPVPVMAEATVLLAGSLRIPLVGFLAATALANAGLAAYYAAVGALAAGVDSIVPAVLGAILLPGASMFALAFRRRTAEQW